jgi:hypothetical protein
MRLGHLDVLIFINNSARGHYVEEILKHRICERRRSPPRALKQHNQEGFKSLLAKEACGIAESRIGIDELAYLISFTSVETENTRR